MHSLSIRLVVFLALTCPSVLFGLDTYEVGESPRSLAIGDLNGDGFADVVVGLAGQIGNDCISVFTNNGNGTLLGPEFYSVGDWAQHVAIADLNGDANPDVVTANQSSNSVSVLVNNGDGTFANHVEYSVGTSPRWVSIGSLNDDAAPDLLSPIETQIAFRYYLTMVPGRLQLQSRFLSIIRHLLNLHP